jgi:hypothetical protein
MQTVLLTVPNCFRVSERISSVCHVPVRLVASRARVPLRMVVSRCPRHVPGALRSRPRAPHELLAGNFPIAASVKRAAPEAWIWWVTPPAASVSCMYDHMNGTVVKQGQYTVFHVEVCR